MFLDYFLQSLSKHKLFVLYKHVQWSLFTTTLFVPKYPFSAYQNDVIKNFAVVMSAVVKRVDSTFVGLNGLVSIIYTCTFYSPSTLLSLFDIMETGCTDLILLSKYPSG